ncbi:hypothetical protein, partial [Nonomuraea sp. NPDC049784]|uniref:hypothetical protein n=1 Tax=Nonomuraea sp. NPDC049784 TaxID=3154361 RepID=UPI0033D9E664
PGRHRSPLPARRPGDQDDLVPVTFRHDTSPFLVIGFGASLAGRRALPTVAVLPMIAGFVP